ncbi:MAG: hypothetical protein H0W42_03235 [Gemmatimonadaceae bacterium]|nr:hypothetical protein [Gemmatimonadaceae bacterium]
MKKTSAITYLVSGDENIRPCDKVLKRTARRVRYDTEVSHNAQDELKPSRRFVVVAHGRRDGTVMWFRSDEGAAAPWLWIGMRKPPKGAHIYLYSCHARKIARHLRHCMCFGHGGVVPMPTGAKNDVVLAYLDQVDRVMREQSYGVAEWRAALNAYVDQAWVSEAEDPTEGDHEKALTLHILRKSLGNPND